MRSKFLLTLAALALLGASDLRSQTPAPAATTAGQAAADQANARANLVLLQQLKAANDETIKKQEAVLATLDALQKAAEEIKIFSKRG